MKMTSSIQVFLLITLCTICVALPSMFSSGSDEQMQADRGHSCDNDEFTCSGGPCIPIEWRCDQDDDCPNDDDELGCVLTCSDHDFTCDDGRCIPATWRCDYEGDCRDNSDERGCPPNSQVVQLM